MQSQQKSPPQHEPSFSSASTAGAKWWTSTPDRETVTGATLPAPSGGAFICRPAGETYTAGRRAAATHRRGAPVPRRPPAGGTNAAIPVGTEGQAAVTTTAV